MALELIAAFPAKVEMVIALPEWIGENRDLLSSCKAPVESVSMAILESISSLQTPNQVFLLVQMSPVAAEKSKVENGLSLYLDDIRDPGNFGTILRIADWFGIEAVFCTLDCVEWTNPKVIQASMGSFIRTPLEYITLAELRKQFPGVPVLGAAMDGESIYQAPVTGTGILAIGSEAHGISKETGLLVDQWIGIPSFGKKGPESLNAAVAAGIICAVIRGRTGGSMSIPG